MKTLNFLLVIAIDFSQVKTNNQKVRNKKTIGQKQPPEVFCKKRCN